MRGVVLQQGKQARIFEAQPTPTVTPGLVLIRVRACALSAVDQKIHRVFKGKQDDLPVGYEVSGVVEEVGAGVDTFKAGDEVVAVLSADASASGCAEYCLAPAHCCAKKPTHVDHKDAASLLLPGIAAFTALHYLARTTPGDSVLISQGASPTGLALIQLANHFGAKVMTTVSSIRDAVFLKNEPHNATIVDLSEKGIRFADKCLELTGGLGMDLIIDDGSLSDNFNAERVKPSKNDIIASLAPHGKWVTRFQDLQLDPPDSQTLFMKGASVSFLFEHVWVLSGSQQGRFLHILDEVMSLASSGVLKAHLADTINLDQVPEALAQPLPDVGKVVVAFS